MLYLEIMSNNKFLTVIDRILGNIFTLGNKLYVKYPNGEQLIIIKKKFGVFKEEYDFYIKEAKIPSLKQEMLSIKPKISVITNNDIYLIYGDLMARSFTISKNYIEIAQVKKVVFSFKDSYKIDIFEDKDELICLSLLIAIDNSIHN